MNRSLFYATAEGHILGKFRTVGEPVGELTERQAKYLEFHGTISKTPPEETKKVDEPKRSEPDPATLDRQTR